MPETCLVITHGEKVTTRAQWVEVRDVARYPTSYRTASTKKTYPVQNANRTKAEKSCIKRSLGYERHLAKETEVTSRKTEHAKSKCDGTRLPRNIHRSGS